MPTSEEIAKLNKTRKEYGQELVSRGAEVVPDENGESRKLENVPEEQIESAKADMNIELAESALKDADAAKKLSEEIRHHESSHERIGTKETDQNANIHEALSDIESYKDPDSFLERVEQLKQTSSEMVRTLESERLFGAKLVDVIVMLKALRKAGKISMGAMKVGLGALGASTASAFLLKGVFVAGAAGETAATILFSGIVGGWAVGAVGLVAAGILKVGTGVAFEKARKKISGVIHD